MARLDGLLINECLENGGDQQRVFVVRDTTTVVYDGTQVVEHFVWNFLVLLHK